MNSVGWREMKNLTMESECLLLLSRARPEAKALERAQELIDGALDWKKLVALSSRHGTSAMIYKNLLRLQNVPDDILDKHRGIYFNLLKSNVLMISELDRIIDGLNSAGVEVITLKGPATSENIFGDIAIYPSDDIDILVKVEDIDRTVKFLEADGYTMNDVGYYRYKDFFIRELYHIGLSKFGFVVEPHWNLFMRYFRTPPDFWWEESIYVFSNGRQYRFLSPEKNLLYNSFRLFSHAYSSLRFLAMCSEIIGYYRDEMDWGKLFAYAKQYHFENVLSAVLWLSRRFLEAPVPDEYCERRGMRMKMLCGCSGRMLMQDQDVDNNFNVPYKVLLTILGVDIPSVLRIFLRRLFPPVGEIVSRYGLRAGSGSVIAYYVLNPFLLLTRNCKK
jgi:hypothetical protein